MQTKGEEERAEISLSHGDKFPYDAPDTWWNDGNIDSPPPAPDWAHRAARGVIVDLQDRRGIKHGFIEIDEEIRVEIVTALANIIRTAAKGLPS